VFVWFQQFVTPNTAGSLADFVRVITIAILATQPKVSQVILATAFVMGLPELLRFLDLPAAVMGPLRSIFYSVFLILVLLFLQRRTLVSNRSV
jgi:ABC-type branched-subunit amino acid transport system permease subunit